MPSEANAKRMWDRSVMIHLECSPERVVADWEALDARYAGGMSPSMAADWMIETGERFDPNAKPDVDLHWTEQILDS